MSADALLGDIIEYLKVRYDGRRGRVASTFVEIQFAVHEWYPTWPVAGRLVEIVTASGVDLDAILLTPIAVAAETELTFATTSTDVADLARPHVPAVVLV
ncbi:MAG: hypothetical protein ACT4OX_11030 [Actinomycetota bacterium]